MRKVGIILLTVIIMVIIMAGGIYLVSIGIEYVRKDAKPHATSDPATLHYTR